MEDMERFYKNIGKIYCPYLKGDVYFTSIGLKHLKFKNEYTARTHKDQYVRIKLLPTALKILSLSNTLQGTISRKRFEERFINSRKEIALLLVTYYEFIAIIEGRKAKVVVKQTESFEKIFLSIIPLFKEKTPPLEGDGFS